MLFNILGKALKILRENLLIVQPFILYLLLLSLLAGSMANTPLTFSPLVIVFLVSVLCLSCAFFAGWFQLLQAAIRNDSRSLKTQTEKTEASINSFREFLPAVGRFFIPITMCVILYVLLFFGILKLIAFLGVKYIGFSENISPNSLMAVFTDQSKVRPFVESLTQSDRHKLLQWDILSLSLMGLFSYLTMFWVPAIMMNGDNAVKGFFTGIKSALTKPSVSIGIFFFYWAVNIATSFLGTIFSGNFFLELLNLVIVVFLTVYFIMVNFVYFEEYSADHIAGWTNLFR